MITLSRSRKQFRTILSVGIALVLILTTAFAALPASAATCPAGEEVYQIRYGDTLSHIANLYKDYGVTIASLKAANGITNANLIYWGRTLCVGIPALAGVPDPTSSACPVKWGYTLSGIAYATGATIRNIRINAHIANPDLIFAGETILIPPPGSGC